MLHRVNKMAEYAFEFKNFIGGKGILLSGRNFVVESDFYPGYRVSAPESSLFDVKTAVSKAKGAIAECRKMGFEERAGILKKAASKISFNQKEFEYIVKNTGMPISAVKELTGDVKTIYEFLPSMIESRIGVKHGKLGHKISGKNDLFAFFEPMQGTVYAVTPGNDIRVTPFIAAWLVSLGIPGIIKCSKNDLLASQKSIRAITEAGYPDGALGVMCWDTHKPENAALNFELVDSAKAVWAYGNDVTVDKLLRFEEKPDGRAVDHFSDKIVLRHATGRAAGVCDSQIDVKQVSKTIVESSLKWPVGCNALKMIFDSSGQHEELIAVLKKEFEDAGKYTGDPMKENTKVGLVDPKLLNHVEGRTKDLAKLGMLKVETGRKTSETQSTPFLLSTQDENSEFLNTEFSLYILTAKKCASFPEAVLEANESAGEHKRLVVSVFSHDEEKVMKSSIYAHHVRRMRHTTEIDLLFHEGNDYFHKLTVPQVHRV
jgi:acyl-CoA reductase-like NAD-dependent aldehyde dehydrogenase